MTIGNASVFDGAVMALAYDDIVPTETEMKKVMEISRPFLTQYQYDLQYAHLVVNTFAGKRSYRDMS